MKDPSKRSPPYIGCPPISYPGQDKLILPPLHSFPWFQRPHGGCYAGLSPQQFFTIRGIEARSSKGLVQTSQSARVIARAYSQVSDTLPSLQSPVAVTGMNLLSDRSFMFAGAEVDHGYNNLLQSVAIP